MRVINQLKAWRARRIETFTEAAVPASIEACIDAAAYELQKISRDFAAVRLHPESAKQPGQAVRASSSV